MKLFSFKGSRRKNPEFLGVNAVDGLVMGGGLFLVSGVKKKVVDPLIAKVPFLASKSGLAHDLVDLGSAGVSAAGAAYAVSIVSPRFGRDVAAAGVAYTGAKGLAIPFKGLGFDESIPQFFTNLRTNASAGKTAKTPALTTSSDTLLNVPSGTSQRSKTAL